MPKIRVGQLAKELNLKVGDVLARLRQLGAEVKSNLSTVEDEVAARLRAAASSSEKQSADRPSPAPPTKQPAAPKQGSRTGAPGQSPVPPARGPPSPSKPAAPGARPTVG